MGFSLGKIGKLAGGAIGGFFGGPAGAAIGSSIGEFGGDALDQYGEKAYDNYTSAEAATKAFDRQVWMASNAYQLKRKDLEAAGFNPMLAVSGPGAQFPGVAVARTDFGGSSVGQLRREQSENVQADTANKEELRAQIVATIDNVVADTVVKRGTAAKVAQEVENLKATLGLVIQQTDESSTREIGQAIANQLAKWDLKYKEEFVKAALRLSNSQAYLSEMSQAEAKQAAEMWSSQMGEVWKYIQPLLGSGKGVPLPGRFR